MTMPPTIPAISAREAADEVAAGSALIIDVRERNEFEQERAAGVALVPISEFVARHEELPKDRPLLMLCAAGSRSSSATMYLLQAGWTDVRNVTGGMLAWRQAGLPVLSGPPAPDEGAIPG